MYFLVVFGFYCFFCGEGYIIFWEFLVLSVVVFGRLWVDVVCVIFGLFF